MIIWVQQRVLVIAYSFFQALRPSKAETNSCCAPPRVGLLRSDASPEASVSFRRTPERKHRAGELASKDTRIR